MIKKFQFEYVKRWALDDRQNGQQLSPDDFREFKRLLDEARFVGLIEEEKQVLFTWYQCYAY